MKLKQYINYDTILLHYKSFKQILKGTVAME